MKKNILLTLISLSIVTLASCQNNVGNKTNPPKVAIQLKVTPEHLAKELKSIRDNYKKINSIEDWTEVKNIERFESVEGGYAEYYYQNTTLEKIITQDFGETYKKLSEYYLKNGELSFVFEKLYKYNRPFYYDSEAKQENNDTEEFDIEKTEIIEDRSYFNKGKLLHQLNNQDYASQFSNAYLLEEQKRLITEFDKLIKLGIKE